MKAKLISCVMALLLTQALCAAEAPVEKSARAEWLGHFVGTWEGQSEDGRFREVSRYRWGPGETHLLLEMAFYVDGESTGTASGFFAWEEENQALLFHMVSSMGVVIAQRQVGREGNRIELQAEAWNGASAGFPPVFRTAIEVTDHDHYDSAVLMPGENGAWQVVMRNHFSRQGK